jgi:hypothetical protein
MNPKYAYQVASDAVMAYDVVIRNVVINLISIGDIHFHTHELFDIKPKVTTVGMLELVPNNNIDGWNVMFLGLDNYTISNNDIQWTHAEPSSLQWKQGHRATTHALPINDVKVFKYDNQVIPTSNVSYDLINEVVQASHIDDYITIGTGDYTLEALMEALIVAFQAKGITLQRPLNNTWLNLEGKLLFSFNKKINLYARHPVSDQFNPMSHVIGILQSTNFATMFTADSIPDLSGLNYIYLRSTVLCQGHCLISGSNLSTPVFAIIPVDPVGGLLVYNETYQDQFSIQFQQPTNISKCDLQITDQLGAHISLQSDANLIFEIVYET